MEKEGTYKIRKQRLYHDSVCLFLIKWCVHPGVQSRRRARAQSSQLAVHLWWCSNRQSACSCTRRFCNNRIRWVLQRIKWERKLEKAKETKKSKFEKIKFGVKAANKKIRDVPVKSKQESGAEYKTAVQRSRSLLSSQRCTQLLSVGTKMWQRDEVIIFYEVMSDRCIDDYTVIHINTNEHTHPHNTQTRSRTWHCVLMIKRQGFGRVNAWNKALLTHTKRSSILSNNKIDMIIIVWATMLSIDVHRSHAMELAVGKQRQTERERRRQRDLVLSLQVDE